ncbi:MULTISPECIES: DMT family transporter [Cylindrospermopsis]|uniref:DMT family transporter n=1 Tax=Cylindrospermopsis curvispora GIHE-G1 TaxID=2666332 RepID=A0A7H0F4A1_9CYAN|nr:MULTISPECIES: DMT family transporter [Cylindrospermopsis]QNP30867.1 DMT family transporter [Cylindrospermopsis curvispora GIHE-G1]TPX29232.1 DMT family transporter [Cylindrospermopsis raciborskii GIHE 2018]
MIQLQEQQKKSPWLPIGSISLAVLTFAFTPILIRTCQEEIGPVSTIFNRYWIAAMILLLWNILKNPRQLLMKNQNLFSQMSQQKLCSICNKTVFLLLLSGFFLATTTVLWSWSLVHTGVANSALLHNLSVFFTGIVEWFFFKKYFNKHFIIGGLIAGGGIIILGLNDLKFEVGQIQGDLVSLFSSLAFCGFLMTVERVRIKVSSVTTMLWCYGLGIILTLPIALINGEQLFPLSWHGWYGPVVLGINAVVVNFLEIYSLQQLSASFVTLVFLIDPILTGILSWWIFGETLSWLNFVAFTVILFGLYLAISFDIGQLTISEHAVMANEISDA